MIYLFQSYYKEEQKEFLDQNPFVIPFDNTSNKTPDLREYPQMMDMHNQSKDKYEAYGLISWKFQSKTLINPSRFLDWVSRTPDVDFWFVNPCQILESVTLTPWEQGEWWHPGITNLYIDTRNKMLMQGGIRSPSYKIPLVIDRERMFFCNYFVAKPHVWQRLFSFTERFYDTIRQNDDLNKRMVSASGYAGDPGMSHFIFLFERIVPTFLVENPDIMTAAYPYTFEEVSSKFDRKEWSYIQTMSWLKSEIGTSEKIANSWYSLREQFLELYPNSISKE